MLKLPQKVLLPSAVILGFIWMMATRTAAQVSNPSDTQPGGSTVQSAPSPVERYGCLSGYDARTYQGDRSISRYEFAAALNACLNQLNQRIDSRSGDRATQEDLAVPKRQLETLKSELERLRMRVDSLDNGNTGQ